MKLQENLYSPRRASIATFVLSTAVVVVNTVASITKTAECFKSIDKTYEFDAILFRMISSRTLIEIYVD